MGSKWSLGLGHCVMFRDKTLDSPSTSSFPGVEMVLTDCEGNLTKKLRVTCDRLDLIQEGQ